MLEFPHPKDPLSSLGYTVDWSDFLATGETIASSSWVIPDGVISASDGFTDIETGIQISGGDDGEDYILQNTITTSLGNVVQRDIKLKVRNR